jgi:DNA-binding transcriptional LysR family regulator
VLIDNTHRRGQQYAWVLNDGSGEREYPVQPVMVANDPATMLPLLAGGQGLMLACDMLVQCRMPGLDVRPIMPAWRGHDMELHAVFLGGRVLSPKVRVFVDFLVEQLSEICPTVQPAPSTSDMCRPELANA